MKLTKRAISLLLTLLMVVGCLSGLSLTASADYYAVWVLGTHVTDSNKNDVLGDGGSVRYNPALGILYLTNAGVLNGQTQNYGGAVIYAAAGNLTIELSGTTTVQAANYGILTTKDLSIHGDGKLIAYGNDSAINVFGTLYLDDEDSDPTVVAQGTAYGIKANSAVLLHGNLTAQTSGGGTSVTVPNAGLYVTGGKLELGSSDPRVFRNNLNLTLLGHDSLPAPDGSPALYAADGIEISSCLNVTAPEDYQLSSDHCRLLTGSGKDATNITVQPKQYYRIQLTGDGGTVTSDQPGDLAFPGQRVSLTFTPDEGCSLVDLVCLDGDGNPIALTHTGSAYSFLMPENSAEVYAFFSDDPNLATYAVDMDASMENGVVIPDYNRQTEGELVTLTVVPDTGYQLTDISVSAGGNAVPLTQNGSDYTFTMPASDVTVHATFEMQGGLYVCGVEVTTDNAANILGDGTASYNFETHTLTVNNLPQNGNLHERAVVWTLMPELTVTGSGYVYSTRDGAYYGIFAENADLTLSGDLTVLGGIDGVKAKSLRVSDVGTEISINGAHISGKVTVRNSVKELFFSGNLYCEELVLGDLEYIASPAGGTASSVINTNVGMFDILHHERHTITVASSFYGTVTADKTEAFPGETIQLTATADAGCAFDSWTVKDANNNTVTVTSNQFTMPDSDVTVTANFHMNAPTTTESYDLYIGNTQVTSSNCMGFTPGYSSGTVRYNPASHTLYFENFTAPEFKNGWLSGNGIIMTHSLDLTLVGTGDISRNMADYSIEAPDNNVTVRGNFQFRSIHAQNVTFDGGSSTVRTYHGVALPVSGVVTVTNNNERLYLEDSYYGGYNYQVTLTTGTFALGDLQLITQGGPTVEALSQTSSNHDAEIRRRPENTVTVEEAVGGRVTASSRTAYETHYVDLTIEPEDGYALQSLTVTDANGDPVDVTVSGSSATFRMPASAVIVTPVFMRGYAVRVASATHGSVTAEKLSYGIGETVTLTVSPTGGYELNELTVFAANGRPVVLTQDPTDQSVYTFPMPGCDVTVAARFARSRYTVNVSKSGNGSYTISDTVARFGDTVTLTTTTEPGYSVQSVTVNNSDTEVTQDGNSYSFIMPAANVTVTVRFVHTLHTVTVEETEHGTVTADKAGAYYGDTVTLTVTPDRSYLCTGLALLYDGIAHPLTLSGNSCSFTMPDADVSIAASFTSPDFRINVNAEHGTVTASPNPAKYTDTVTLTATPDTGYRLTDLCVEEDSLVNIPVVTPSLTALHGNRISGGEEYYRLVDGNTQTRWYPNEAPSATNPYIVIKTNQPVCLTEYTLTEAHDLSKDPGSRWKSWTIYGANFDSDSDATQNSDAWQVVAVIVDDTLLQPVNFATATYTLDAPAAQYQYYKIVVNASQGSSRVRMGEFSMRGLLMAPHDEASNDWTFTMPAKDVTVTAEFTPIDYEITVDEQAHAVTTVPETAHYGDKVQPTANVDEGWSLLGFTVTDEDGTVLPTYADNSFDMPAKSVTVAPRLEAANYTIAIPPTANGSVTASKTIANCGDEITLTVTPDEGYILEKLTVLNFSYETVYQSTVANEYKFTMPARSLMVVAKFVAAPYSVTVQNAEHGTVTASLSMAGAGMTVTLNLTPDTGYELDTLTVTDANGNPISVENDQFTMPASDVTVTASFKAIDYNVTVTPATNGTITADKATAQMGETVTLSATPDEGYALSGYTVTDANSDPVPVENNQFTMPASDVTVTATFTLIDYTVTAEPATNGTVAADKATAKMGDTVTLSATPDEGYALSGYTVTDANGEPVPVENNQFTMPASNVTVTATFTIADYTVTVAPPVGGTISADPVSAHMGDTVTLTATAYGENSFESWSVTYGDNQTLTVENDQFTMPAANVTVTATFNNVIYDITIAAAEHGTVTADRSAATTGEIITLTTVADEGYALNTLQVTANGNPVPMDGNQFTMPASAVTVTATFGTSLPYVDAQGNAMTPVDTWSAVKSDTTTLTEGWWVVTGSVTNNNRLTVSGSVNLILCDGATLNATSGIAVGGGNSLTIWAQSHDSSRGKLIARATSQSYAGIGSNSGNVGAIEINGGIITAAGGYQGAGIGGGVHSTGGSITINNGKVSATGGTNAAGIGGGGAYWGGHYGNLDTITITGGEVTATGSGYGAGIGGGGTTTNNAGAGNVNTITITGGQVTATSPNGYGIGPGVNSKQAWNNGSVNGITFGWTETTDFIQSSKNVGADKLAFVEGKDFLIDELYIAATTSNIQSACKLIPLTDLSLLRYSVTIASGITNGTVTTDKAIAQMGDTVTLTVTSDEGYELDTLTVTDANGNPVPVENDQFTMPESDVTVTASFIGIDYNVTVTPATNGTVTADRAVASTDQTVTLTVTPDEGYGLDTLTVTDTNGNRVTVVNKQFTMPASDVTVSATFAPLYTVTVAETVHGRVSANISMALVGDQISLTVTPDEGYELDALTVTDANGDPVTVENNRFTMPESDVTVTASFTAIDYNITVTPGTNGTVTADRATAQIGDTVTLTATPNKGYNFISYTVTDANGDPVTVENNQFTMPASDVTVTATFALPSYTVTVVQQGGGTVTADKATAQMGETVTLTATPYANCTLVSYTVTDANGDPVTVTGNQFIMPASNVTVTATFEGVGFTVTVDPSAGGTVTADKDSALYGETVTLTATPDTGYGLVGFTVTDANGASVTVENNQFTMPEANVTVTALFGTSVPYVDARGNALASAGAYPISADTTELTAGWWFVTGSVTTNNRLTVSGSVNLILCDGATLNATKGIAVGGGNSLTVWAQSHGVDRGKLIAGAESKCAAIGSNQLAVGTIEINGGEITATGGSGGAGIGGGQNSTGGSITINNGKITATGNGNAAGIGGGNNIWAGHYGNLDTITITGGEVTATGNEYGAGIGGGGTNQKAGGGGNVNTITITGGQVTATSPRGYGIGPGMNSSNAANNGNVGDCITFGWTETTDFIQSSKNVSADKLVFAEGKAFLIDGETPVAATTDNVQSACKLIPNLSSLASHNVTVTPTTNGTVIVDKATANSGETVTLTVTPDEGYELDTLTVTDANGDPVAAANNQFIMPDSDVTVTAAFKPGEYTVTVAESANGSVAASAAAAHFGDEITLTITPDEGYELDTLTVTDANGDPVTVENNQFTMPASDVTVNATFKAGAAPVTYTYFVGNSLSLEGDIGVNFYVKLNDVAPANARVEFAWGSGSKAGTQSAALADLTADANGLYKLTVRVAAAQMTDTITAKLYDGETLVDTQQYSVAQYARYAIGADDATLLPLCENNQTKVDNLRALCRAMLIYGAKSQLQFKYNTYAPADQGLVYTLETPGTLGTTVFPDGFADACGIAFYGASLVLDSTTTYRLYFTVTDQDKLDALTVTCGGKTLTCATKDDMVYFDVAGIAAAYVFKDQTVRFGSIDVTVNAGSYVTGVLGGSNETLKDAVKALYAYSEAARTFFGVS